MVQQSPKLEFRFRKSEFKFPRPETKSHVKHIDMYEHHRKDMMNDNQKIFDIQMKGNGYVCSKKLLDKANFDIWKQPSGVMKLALLM